METIVGQIAGALRGLGLLVLPPWRRGSGGADFDLTRWSFAIGLAQIVIGALMWVMGGLSYMGAFSDSASTVFWATAQTDAAIRPSI